MADELEAVTQRFDADMAEYAAEIEEGVTAAEEFAAANREAQDAVDSVRDSAVETSAAQSELRDSAVEAGEGLGHERDEALETAAAVKELRDALLEAAAASKLGGGGGGGDDPARKAGEQAGNDFGQGFSLMSPQVLIPLIAAALATLPALFAVAGAGAGIALGAAFLISTNAQVKAGATSMVATLKGVMTQATQPMIQPLEDAFKQIGSFAKQIEPELRDVFAAVSPYIQPLVSGLEGLVSGILPGFVTLMQAAKPAVDAVAGGLKTLGSGLGGMFTQLATAVGPSSQILTALFSIIGTLLPVIGQLASVMATALAPVFTALATVVAAVLPPIASLVSTLVTALSPAWAGVAQGIAEVAGPLAQLIAGVLVQGAPLIQVIATLFGWLASTLGGSLGAALQNIMPPLEKLAMVLLGGLATVLGQVIGPLADFFGVLTDALSDGIINMVTDMVPGLIQIANILLMLLQQVIVPNLPAIEQLALAFVKLSMATLPLVGPITQLVAMLLLLAVKVLIPLTPLLIMAITGFTQFVTWLTGVVTAVAKFLGIGISWISNLHNIADAFDKLRHTVATWGHDIASAFDTARHAVATAGHDIQAALEAVVTWVQSHWKDIVAWLADPIGMAVNEIKTHTHDISAAFDQLRHDVAAIVDGIGHDFSTAWDTIRHQTAATVDAIPGDIEKAFDTIRHDAAALGDDVLKAIKSLWTNTESSTKTGASNVGSFFQKLPGQVVAFLAALPGQMLTIGRNVIDGLINGIKNAAADIPGIMHQLASDVASYFTDPLKILSPSLVFFEHGVNIVRGAINGVKSMAPQLLATMRGLGTSVATGGIGAASAVAPAIGGGAANVHVQVNAQGPAGVNYADPRYQQALQQAVQEVTLRHAQMNPTNGLTPTWGR